MADAGLQDPLVHADAIVVLSGHIPERALEAARFITRATPIKYGFHNRIFRGGAKTMKIFYLGGISIRKNLLAQRVPRMRFES